MNLRLPTLLAAILATLTVSTTSAQGKPSIAILGLEVQADGDAIDEQATKLANSLTSGLRKRATMPNGPFRLAPNSDKDLLELKLLSDCFDEARACMAAIGRELKADRLLYGRIKKRGNGYQVSLDLLNVSNKTMERSTSEIIPFAEASGASVKSWSRSLYNRLTGVPDLGSLVITANVDKGTVYVDGEVKTSLRAGEARITGLSEGSHTIGVESDGYEAYGGEITISAGETEELRIDLESEPDGKPGAKKPGRGGGVSRVLFWTSLVATGAGATAMTITGLQVRGTLKTDQLRAISELAKPPNGIELDTANACTDAETMPNDPGVQAVIDACDAGKSRAMLTNIFLGATLVSAVAASYFYYKGFMVPAKSSRKEKKTMVHIEPTIGPNQVGAGVTIEF